MMHLASMILMLGSLAVAPDVQEPSSVTRCQAGFPKKVYAPPAQATELLRRRVRPTVWCSKEAKNA